MSGYVMLVRVLPGLIGESQRVVHVVPAAAGLASPQTLKAYCGMFLDAGQVELLERITGMPCDQCVLKAPLGQPEPSVLSGGGPPPQQREASPGDPAATALCASRRRPPGNGWRGLES